MLAKNNDPSRVATKDFFKHRETCSAKLSQINSILCLLHEKNAEFIDLIMIWLLEVVATLCKSESKRVRCVGIGSGFFQVAQSLLPRTADLIRSNLGMGP